MCRFEIAVLMWTVVAGPAAAQNNVSERTKILLALEWKETATGGASGVIRCLTALDDYTAYNAGLALPQLLAGVPQIPGIDSQPGIPLLPTPPPGLGPMATALYTRADAEGRMPDFLAKATTLSIDGMSDKAKKDLFDAADKSIRTKYGADPASLDTRVNKLYDIVPLRALYNLLSDLYPAWTNQADADAAAKTMELYRTCYLLDKYKFFGLVRTFLQ